MKTKIRLGAHDAALVIRANGTLESWLPHVHGDPPDNAVAASMLMCAYFDERIMTMVAEAMANAGYEYPSPPIRSVSEQRNRNEVQ